MHKVLITGGAGFIGSHITDLLLAKGYSVRLLDNLARQVHPDATRPSYLAKDAELVVGDVRDKETVERALGGIDSVIHLAASVGVGQSMYEIVSYTSANDVGTAVLVEALARRPVERLVCASSMSVYGEGAARRSDGHVGAPKERSRKQLRRGLWELNDEEGSPLSPVATPETKLPSLSSVYALNKYVQERLCLIAGAAYKLPTVALRFFNVYGPRQALSNPYTGVLAIFAARLLHGRPPLVFEDGCQRRDFVHVSDVVQANLLAMESSAGDYEVFNVGMGVPTSVQRVAELLAAHLGVDVQTEIVHQFRAGDIRHCYADVGKITRVLGYRPSVAFEDGLDDLVAWARDQRPEDG